MAKIVEPMKTLLWHHLPCDDEASQAPRRGAEPAPDGRAAAVHARPRRSGASPRGSSRRRWITCTIPFLLADMAQGGRTHRARDRAKGADRDPRRLRRRRHHLDGDPAPRARDARRRSRALHPRAAARRLRPAAGGDRAAARRRRPPRHLRRLRHPRHRGGAARARARRRPDHHRPPRARRHAAAGARRDQPEAVTTARTPTRTSPASASR